MASFRKRIEITEKENSDESFEIINKLNQILQNQADLSQEMLDINVRLCDIEKKIEANADVQSEQLALLEETTKNKVPTLEFPIKSEEDMVAIDKEIQHNLQKYVDIIKLVISPQGLKENFLKIIDSTILLSYNYDGIKNKKAFKDFKFINMAIFEAIKKEGSNEKEYIEDIKKCFRIHKARHFRKMSYKKHTRNQVRNV